MRVNVCIDGTEIRTVPENDADHQARLGKGTAGRGWKEPGVIVDMHPEEHALLQNKGLLGDGSCGDRHRDCG
jgi:hypothetical protein